ncbi:MAG: hypothetical protein AAF333_01320 [Planctomycetota bacterium]
MFGKSMVFGAWSLLGCFVSLGVSAQVFDVRFAPVPGTSPNTHDILISFEQIHVSTQLQIVLDEGQVLTVDPGNLFPLTDEPGDRFFITNNNVPVTFSNRPTLFGAAVDIDPNISDGKTPIFSAQFINVAYGLDGAQLGVAIPDQFDYLVARVPLSPDAQGTLDLFFTHGTLGQPTSVASAFTFPIIDGRIVPEPASGALVLTALALACAPRRPRRNAA